MENISLHYFSISLNVCIGSLGEKKEMDIILHLIHF